MIIVVLCCIDLYKQPDRVAVITGGNRGIGLGIIKKLLECEMTVVMGKCFNIFSG